MRRISRAEARALGIKRYFTGEPCHRGGVAERSVGNGECHCTECVTVRRDRKNSANKRFRADNLGLMLVRERGFYHANAERLRAERRKWYAANAERLSKKGRSLAVRERAKARSAEWRRKNPEWRLELVARRQQAKRQAVPSWYGEFDEFVFREAKSLCWQRRRETGVRWDIDHLIPISSKKACGLHCAQNWQVIPHRLNLQKHNKMIFSNRYAWVRFAWAR